MIGPVARAFEIGWSARRAFARALVGALGVVLGCVVLPAAALGADSVYWGNFAGANQLSFVSLDATAGGDLTISGATVNQPLGVAIDAGAGRIYWANDGTYTISFANLDGSGGGDLNTSGATVIQPLGVAVDPAAPGGGRIYWANLAGRELSYARLDGSGGGDLATLTATVTGPAPGGAAAATVGSTLSCSTGTWAADLTPAHLSRAPHSFAYQWSRDGNDIAGANSSTIVADAPGDYRCRVAATNHAGSASQTSDPHTVSPAAAETAGASSPTAAPAGAATSSVAPSGAPTPTGAGTGGGPSNHFSVGRLHGTTLTVTVASPGTLRVVDASSSPAADVANKRRSTPFLRRTSVAGGPGVITVKLRLTASATATLKHHHRLTAKARLTFTPTGGTPATTTAKLTIKTPRGHKP